MIRSIPAVVLPSGHHGDLGIARSLGRMGVAVYTAGAAWWEPVYHSRYCRGHLHCNLQTDIAAWLETGKRLGRRPVLIPTTDQQAVWVAEHAQLLQEAFRIPGQDPALIRTLCNKVLMQDLARRCGLIAPKSVTPRSKAEIEEYLQHATFPLILKAINVENMRLRTGGTKFVIRSRSQLLDIWSRAGDPAHPNFFVQEFVPGEDWMFDGYFDRHSNCLFGMTGRKIRRFPVHTGVTSLGVCVHNEAVASAAMQFMKAVGYQGILDIGFRFDKRDGTYKVLDANPRIGCTFRLFLGSNGMDAARALYLDLTEQTIAPSTPLAGRKWIVEDFDLVSSLRLWWEGRLSSREWLRSLHGVQETACFARDDPIPSLWIGTADIRILYSQIRRAPFHIVKQV